MTKAKPAARLNLQLPLEVRHAIKDAAAIAGQTVNEFAVTALAQAAHRVLHEQRVTQLSIRDHQLFLELIDQQDMVPNRALAAVAKRYKKQVRQR